MFLKDVSDFPVVNGVYGEYFAASLPARLPREVRVEIDCIAAVG